jgi:hypothetical protein
METVYKYDNESRRLDSGEHTPETLLAAFESLVSDSATCRAELTRLTKDKLKRRITSLVWHDDKKPALIEKAFDSLLMGLNPGECVSYQVGSIGGMIGQSRESLTTQRDLAYQEAIRQNIRAATVESLAAYAAKRAADRAAYLERVRAHIASIKAEKAATEVAQ